MAHIAQHSHKKGSTSTRRATLKRNVLLYTKFKYISYMLNIQSFTNCVILEVTKWQQNMRFLCLSTTNIVIIFDRANSRHILVAFALTPHR
jgi:hypothetical protein